MTLVQNSRSLLGYRTLTYVSFLSLQVQLTMSFKMVLVVLFLVFATVNSEDETLVDHIRNHEPWKIDPPQNIYGNKSVNGSTVMTWGKNKEAKDQKVKVKKNAIEDVKAVEERINEQINRELFACYTYTSMVAHFDRDDISLPGFVKFFKEAAEEEYKQAMMLMEYQNKRGGRVKLHPIRQPFKDQWGNGLMAMKEALKVEKTVYHGLRDVRKAAEDANEPQMMDFIEGNFLREQIDSIKMLGNYINTLKRLGNGLGEYQFDKITLGGGKRSD